jgi:hypothetical protein
VVLTSGCPSSSWTVRMSWPSSSEWFANEWRSVCGVAPFGDPGVPHRPFHHAPEDGLVQGMPSSLAGVTVHIQARRGGIPVARPIPDPRSDTCARAPSGAPPNRPRAEGRAGTGPARPQMRHQICLDRCIWKRSSDREPGGAPPPSHLARRTKARRYSLLQAASKSSRPICRWPALLQRQRTSRRSEIPNHGS